MLRVLEPNESAALREAFLGAGYTDHGLVETLGAVTLPSRSDRMLPYFLHLTRRRRPLDTLIRLFLVGVPVPVEDARSALEPDGVERCLRAGLLEIANGRASGLVKMMHFRGLLVAVDQIERAEVAALPDQVVGVTASTVSAADFAVSRPSRATLDLGTGCGILAFLLARHSRHVCATDRSLRAVEFARFNAALNGVENIEFLEGDSFEPVRGRRFDLVLSNPPFAVSPSSRYLYRDGGLEGDGFCRHLVRQAPALLEEGGWFQITCDWAHTAGQDWKERLAGWFQGSGCDVLVLRSDTQEPAIYTQLWIGSTEHGGAEQAAQSYNDWMSFYERERIEAVSSGLIAMRRASNRPNWIRFEDLPENTPGPIGEFIALAFDLRDFLERAASDDALLDAKLRVAPGLRLDQRCEPSGGTWQIASAQLRLTRGMPFAGNIDRHAVMLVGLCDGRPFRDVIAGLAGRLGVNTDLITADCVKLVRPLVERGFLLPEGVGEEAAV